MKQEIEELIEEIKHNYEKNAIDIKDSLDLLNLSFDGLLDSLNEKMTENHKNRIYEDSGKLVEMCKKVSEIQQEVFGISELLSYDNYEENVLEDDDENENTLINYKEYEIDSSIPHSIYEDFTHMRVDSFTIKGKNYKVSDWKELLVKTCNILSEYNAEKFYGFIGDSSMKGRKHYFFGSTLIETDTGKKNEKLKNVDIYVWTNLSANSIRNLVRKLLKKFDIKFSEYNIFLRADYSSLHNYKSDDSKYNDQIVEDEKIGIYVRNNLRRLSEENYPFTIEDLKLMQSEEWCKKILGIYQPLLKQYTGNEDISKQVLVNNYPRYWKEIFQFSSEKFLVSSQWYPRFREKFDDWLDLLKK